MNTEWSAEGRAELFAAYVKAQSQMGDVIKKATNPAFKSKYADLAAVVEAVVPAFNANGMAVIQSPSYDGEAVTVETFIIHQAGGYLRAAMQLRPSKSDPQGIGSCVTYGRRYALLALSGAAPEDDDGNAASGPVEATRRFQTGDPMGAHTRAPERKSAAQAKRDGDHTLITQELAACQSERMLDDWYSTFDARTAHLPLAWLDPVRDEVEKRRNEILDAAAEMAIA